EAERISGRPFAGRFAVYAFRSRHERIGRLHAFDEGYARSIQHFHLTAHARLRGDEQRFNVAAYRIEMLALMDEIAVGAGQHLFDALLAAGHDELFELAMGADEHFRGRRFESDPTFRADDRVAQVNAAAHAELRADRFELLDQRDRIELHAVKTARRALCEADGVRLGRVRVGEGGLREPGSE